MKKLNLAGAGVLLLSSAALWAASPVITQPAKGGLPECQENLSAANAKVASLTSQLNTCTNNLNTCNTNLTNLRNTCSASTINPFAGVWQFNPTPGTSGCAALNGGSGDEFGITNTGHIMVSQGNNNNNNNGGHTPLTDIGTVSAAGQISAATTDTHTNCPPQACTPCGALGQGTCTTCYGPVVNGVCTTGAQSCTQPPCTTTTCTATVTGTCASGSCSLHLAYTDGSSMNATATEVSQ